MLILIFGLILWTVGHYYRRVLPGLYAQMGATSKLIAALMIIGSVGLMIWGYRAAPWVDVWSPPAFFTHINNLLMIVALYVYFSTAALPGKVWIASKIRHPQLIGFKIWTIAHLLVNGDLASILLFGGLLAWAVVQVILINRGVDHFDRSKAPIKNEFVFAAFVIVAFTVIAALHVWAGKNPFG